MTTPSVYEVKPWHEDVAAVLVAWDRLASGNPAKALYTASLFAMITANNKFVPSVQTTVTVLEYIAAHGTPPPAHKGHGIGAGWTPVKRDGVQQVMSRAALDAEGIVASCAAQDRHVIQRLMGFRGLGPKKAAFTGAMLGGRTEDFVCFDVRNTRTLGTILSQMADGCDEDAVMISWAYWIDQGVNPREGSNLKPLHPNGTHRSITWAHAIPLLFTGTLTTFETVEAFKAADALGITIN